jgi:hypothetical protein
MSATVPDASPASNRRLWLAVAAASALLGCACASPAAFIAGYWFGNRPRDPVLAGMRADAAAEVMKKQEAASRDIATGPSTRWSPSSGTGPPD